MIKKKISFKKFTVETTTLFDGLRDYSPPFWPLEWSVVCSAMEYPEAKAWLKDNARDKYNIHPSLTGCVISFESTNDSVKFRLSNN